MLPNILLPNAQETIVFPSNQVISIPKVNLYFNKWTGILFEDTFNKKPVLDYNGEAVFAELAILRIFQNEGWEGVWVDTYRKKYRIGHWGVNTNAELPAVKQLLLDNIYKINGNRSGCWDVFCWKEDKIIFAEAKRQSKDKIRTTQIKWLEAAFKSGLNQDSFLIVEWLMQN